MSDSKTPRGAIVTDTSCLINLLHLHYSMERDLIPKLSLLFATIHIPKYVWKEFGRKMDPPEVQNVMRDYPFLKLCNVGSETDAKLLYDKRLSPKAPIDRGEAEAIVQARELGVSEVLIDERKGRRIAESHSLSVRGVLGLLTELKRNGVVREVKPLIEELVREKAFRIAAK